MLRRIKNGRIRKRSKKQPDPLIISTSDEFIGNDGPWSVFNVRVGTPPQLMKMIASTSSAETFIINTKGCKEHEGKECMADRGYLYNSTASSTWSYLVNKTNHALESTPNSPHRANLTYGLETINFMGKEHASDSNGTSIQNQIVAETSSRHYWTSTLGLNPKEVAISSERSGHISNIRYMKELGLIPSLSYGFTAGARNRRQGASARQARASLILGGYDDSLQKHNSVDFKMSTDPDRDLSVLVKGINMISNGSDPNARTAMSSKAFTAVVDSGVAPFYLPPEICDSFAAYLGLKYNSTVGTYLINEANHIRLENDSPALEILLAPNSQSAEEVTIQIPYDSLELRMTRGFPNSNQWSRYFPIRPTTDPSQYTLGRAFLQEVYLIANYEQRNFSLAQREYETDNSVIIPIPDPARLSTTGDEVSNTATFGLIAGGCALAGLLILLLIWRCHRRRDKKQIQDEELAKTELESIAPTIFELDKSTEVFELTGNSSRVEAVNPDMKCAYDEEAEVLEAQEILGPFEMAANEPVEIPSSKNSVKNPDETADDHHDEVISPIEGEEGDCIVSSESGTYRTSSFHSVSPITPTDINGLEPMEERLPVDRTKTRDEAEKR